MYRFVLTIFFISTLSFLASCKHQNQPSQNFIFPSISDKKYQRNLYEKAVELLENKNFEKASKEFYSFSKELPFNDVARKALLMSAFAKYKTKKYLSSASLGEEYIAQYPNSEDIDYVYYLVGMSYAQKIRNVSYDQHPTQSMVQYMSEILEKYPKSPYSKGAQFYLSIGRNQLAGQEMYVGRYYLKNKEYVSAILRFQLVIANYFDTEQVEEAMARLVEAYFMLGLVDEATSMASVIQQKYPKGLWSDYVSDLVQLNK
ncbi:outer membrane assembly lipoprotein YfiO [Candidatus Liberibacter solanacearum CLso-ZC1]|uniref:Outer membrane protein assembly factor BamD n=1 Tax=Liberibacter solanacearum (strain CLso-ZC1) TaxID=658172 RepID=E4UB91_LIBSC|nr:outer membrane assembly lipoprotein YfiO [Candidatus Liberibacter solanacearum CLso-ZC1]